MHRRFFTNNVIFYTFTPVSFIGIAEQNKQTFSKMPERRIQANHKEKKLKMKKIRVDLN